MRRKIRRKFNKRLIKGLLSIILIISWLLAGWPSVWLNPRFPPKIEEARAAAISYKKGSFTASTAGGNQQITGVGFQPKAVIFFYTTQTAEGNSSASSGYGVGFTAGSGNSRSVATYSVAAGTSDTARVSSETKAIYILSGVATVGGAATLSSFDTDGFTINWSTTPAVAYIIHYIAIGGDEISNATTGTFTLTTGTGSLSVTGTGFQPDFLMFLGIGSNSASETIDAHDLFHIGFASGASDEAGLSLHSRDAQGTSDTCSVQRSDNAVVLAGPAGTACNTTDALADLTSFDSNGFTLNKSDAPNANVKVHYLALKGGRHKVAVFNSPTTTGNLAVTGTGFKPEGLILTSFAQPANTAAVANYFFGLGGTDGSTQGRISRADADADANPDPDVSTVTTQAFGAYTANGTVGLAATFTSFDNDGFTLNWGTVQTTARQIIYWAMAGKPTYTQSAYRFFNNQDSTDVGTPLANLNTPATLSSSGAAFRLRMLMHIGASQLSQSGENFKLQFAQRGADNQCDTSFNGETYSDLTFSTAGPLSPSTIVNVNSSSGTFSWSNPGNAGSSDNNYATVSTNLDSVTHYLKATGFGFNIPSNAFISGIVVEIEKHKDVAGTIEDNEVLIVKGGNIGTTNRALAGNWPTADEYSLYGDSTDTWGETWTAEDINSSNFGVAISAGILTFEQTTAYIDHIRITVYYSSQEIVFNNNLTPNDGAALTANANDPTHGSDTIVNQTYEEANNFTNSVAAIPAGQDGKWDFSLIDNGGNGNTYCFRVVKSDGTVLDTYSVIPEITTAAATTTLTQNDFEWFVDEASVTLTDPWPSGSVDLAENEVFTQLPATKRPLVSGDRIRIQMNITVGGANLSAGTQAFQLEYVAASDCTTATGWSTVGAVGSATIWRFFDNTSLTDGVTQVNQISTSTSGAEGRYLESNSASWTNPNAVSVGQSMEWDFAIENNGAAENTTYCFRLTKYGGTALDTYNSDSYPKLTTAPGVSNLMRHGNFFQGETEKGFYWAN